MNLEWQKLLDLIKEEVRGAARFRWWALLTAWVVCLAGWAIVALQHNVFAANARVFVDTRTSLDPVLQGLTINQDANAQLNLVSQSLLGDAQLEKLASELGLDRKVETEHDRAKMIARMRESVSLSARGAGGSGSIYTITYDSYERETSLKAVQLLLDAFEAGTLSGKRASAEAAQAFLTQKIEEYESKMLDAEQRLADFKRRNVGQMPGAQGDYTTRMQAAMHDVDTLKSRLSVATTQRDALRRQLDGNQDDAVPGAALGLDVETPTTRAIKEAQDRLDELRLRFTEKHPDVVAAKESLVQLEARRAAELASWRGGSSAVSGVTANPVVQKIQVALNDAEIEIAGLRSQLADKERSVNELRALVNVVPEVEAEYARLNRDYDFYRQQRNEFVARLDKASLGQEAESADSIKFEIIEPPTAGFTPIKPNRPLLMSAVLLLGIGAGGGLAYLLHMLRPVFYSNQALQNATGYPVLGVVAMTWLERYKRQRMLGYAGFAVGAAGLVVALVALMQLQPRMPFFLT